MQNTKKMTGGPLVQLKVFASLIVPKQAGTGPSRRHIQGSKIAKRHQSFKVFSSTALKTFFEKSLTTPKKTERRNPLGFSNIHSVAKHQKNAGGTL